MRGLLDHSLAETAQRAIEPEIVGQIADAVLRAQRLEMLVLDRPGRIILHQRNRSPPADARSADTRVRRVKDDGPHLHSELICAEPFSANTSHVK